MSLRLKRLWSLRAPINFRISSLNDVKLDLSITSTSANSKSREKKTRTGISSSSATASGQTIMSRFECDGETHAICLGHGSESSSCRILLPVENRTNDEGIISNNMKPLSRAFDRHVNLVRMPPSFTDERVDVKRAPSVEAAPEPKVDGEKVGSRMRVAYEPVKQVCGMKRRWRVTGATIGGNYGGIDLVDGAGGTVGIDKTDDANIVKPIVHMIKDDYSSNDASTDGREENSSRKKHKKSSKKVIKIDTTLNNSKTTNKSTNLVEKAKSDFSNLEVKEKAKRKAEKRAVKRNRKKSVA